MQPPVVVKGHSTEDVQLDVREIDVKEEDRLKQFLINGCECSMKCTSKFTQQHFQLMRSNAMELNRTELDMTVMGQVMAFTHCSKATINFTKHRHQIKRREKNTTTYHHQGVKVCRKTFLFLHNIGEFHLKAIKAQYLAEGLVPRIHGHSGRIAPNALVLEHVQSIVTFVMQYAETNGILLPGRIPGYKRDDIQLLPSSTTKRAVCGYFFRRVLPPSLQGLCHTPRSVGCGGTSSVMLWSANQCQICVRLAREIAQQLFGL